MVVRLQKGRRSADVFACLKVLVELFQKLARVKAAHAFSPSQRRNALAAFLFAKLFLCAFSCQRKSG